MLLEEFWWRSFGGGDVLSGCIINSDVPSIAIHASGGQLSGSLEKACDKTKKALEKSREKG